MCWYRLKTPASDCKISSACVGSSSGSATADGGSWGAPFALFGQENETIAPTSQPPCPPALPRWFAPAGLFVQRSLGEPAQSMNRTAIRLHRCRRQQRTRRLIHKRHELV